MYKHILDVVATDMSRVFLARGLLQPVVWGDISESHLDVIASFMDDLHKGLETAVMKQEDLFLKPFSWNRFLKDERLDDSCVDYMLVWLVQFVGSRMAGLKRDTGALLKTQESDQYYVLGVSEHRQTSKKNQLWGVWKVLCLIPRH